MDRLGSVSPYMFQVHVLHDQIIMKSKSQLTTPYMYYYALYNIYHIQFIILLYNTIITYDILLSNIYHTIHAIYQYSTINTITSIQYYGYISTIIIHIQYYTIYAIQSITIINIFEFSVQYQHLFSF